MTNDPIADFIAQIMNAGAVGKERVSVPYSKLKHAVADKLVEEGYLKSAEKRGKKVRKTLDLELIYENDAHRIRGARRLSKPSRRLYTHVSGIHPVKYGKGTLVLSTPAGILTGDEARKTGVGGERLFEIF